jgi:hypothetical protein
MARGNSNTDDKFRWSLIPIPHLAYHTMTGFTDIDDDEPLSLIVCLNENKKAMQSTPTIPANSSSTSSVPGNTTTSIKKIQQYQLLHFLHHDNTERR